ncbi:toxin-antitoxin system PIN domain toxin [Microlunatus sagamiharensis]|uniref:Ribonuclease VapC n=1 Tax=Microlunatus sagamiharensis TaxID=546874 RepID=A0A1H2N4K1_9ACTN|nr:toxin-antitoxin system PIN domain toxin [Microlunatus sagamiharensis]
MLIPDVNVLVAALRSDHEHHDVARSWLQSAVAGVEPVGVTESVLAAVVRVVTNPRIFRTPTPAVQILGELERLRAVTQVVRPGRSWWSVFRELCVQSSARGPLVSDAAHAATAIEAGATWVTFDRHFARFPGLRWQTP